MYLKSLTLSGFKSFGKTTIFDFPVAVTAIVGPNGSGKSNVAEAIRWVLGEQSMKSLRGKRGEDLIFSGSEHAARLGRAEVKLIFDNSHKQFPFEFEDVIISRRVMRDGANEYLLNNTLVRLKDIFELLSRVGLGSTQHHIISQGEVDRILWASPAERQEMIEEALGLKEYHIKQLESERKLAETDVNMKQVEAQRREIQPHLKFLRAQAEKMKAHEDFRQDLNERMHEYALRERAALLEMEVEYNKIKDPLLEQKIEKENFIVSLQKEIVFAEKQFSGLKITDSTKKELDELSECERQLARELGRVEGQIESEAHDTGGAIPAKTILREIRDTVAFTDKLMQSDSFESLKSGLKDVKVRLEAILKICAGESSAPDTTDLQKKKEAIARELKALEERVLELRAKRQEDETVREDIIVDLREREHELRDHERELETVREQLREIEFRHENYKTRKTEWESFIADANIEIAKDSGAKPFASEGERGDLHRKIERLRIKLEEAGGIDESVTKEYEETQTRDQFLGRELEDLVRARKSLEGLMDELEKKLKEQFTEGLKKINAEFQIFFKNIFGGGKALLLHTEPKIKKGEDDEASMPTEALAKAGGIEISLDIPRKRLRSLDMLSGGERALTSVALLFAISSVNPPPFLVLDETDAALDEANSQRYGDLLELLAKKTQLVVITHNRQTMGRAGVLYGVTMGNDGISKILSLKFDEAREYAAENI